MKKIKAWIIEMVIILSTASLFPFYEAEAKGNIPLKLGQKAEGFISDDNIEDVSSEVRKTWTPFY